VKKRIFAISIVLILAIVLTACGGSSSQSSTPSGGESGGGDQVVELVLGGVTSDSAKEAVTFFAEKVAEYSNGTIKIIDFPDNQLGNDETRFEMTQTGECDISIGSTSSVAATYNDFYIYDVPFMFLNKNEVYDIGFNGEAGKQILNGLEELGLKGLAFWENGFRNLTTTNKEIKGIEDLNGLKIRTMENDIHLAAWKAMGANPTPMAFSELFTALQQGTVDGQENPIGIIVGNGFEEVQKYLVMTEHVYTPYYVVMNLDKYNSLTQEQKDALEKAMAEATLYQYERSQYYEDISIEDIEAAGCKVIKLTDEEKMPYKNAVEKIDAVAMAKKKMARPELADKLVKELEAAR
jgi:tripartite ATP-independent transporter DctP family solute receptor